MDRKTTPSVLYIEDSIVLGDLFKEIIESKFGYIVDIAQTGQDGIDQWRAGNYHAIAVDYQLPDINGLEISAELLSTDPSLPIVMVTGFGDESIAASALNLGVSNYVVKGTSSVYFDILPSIIEQLVKRTDVIRRAIKAEDALQRSEARLRGAIESLTEGFALFDADDKLIAANSAYQEHRPICKDYTQKDIYFKDILRANFQNGLFSNVEDDVESVIKTRMEQHNNPGGTLLRQLENGAWWMIKDARTKDGSTTVISTDVTKLKAAEDAVWISEQRYKTTFEHARIGIANISIEGTFLTVNDRFSEILAYDKDTLCTMSYMDITHPEDKEIGYLEHREVLEGKRDILEAEKRYLRSDGAVIWCSITSSLTTNEAGTPEYFTTVFEDVTARKRAEDLIRESEERFRATFENTTVGSIVINNKGLIEIFNSAASQIFGYNADEVVGRNIGMLMPESMREDHDSYLDAYSFSQDSNVIGVPREMVGVRKTGEEFPMQLGVSKIQLGDNISYIGSINDLSETKSLEAKLRQSQKMEAVGQLTGGIAHDFNNLLAIIIGNIELLTDYVEGQDEPQELIQRTQNAVERGAVLTQQLLAFSRRQALRPETLSMNTLILSTVTMLKRTLGENIKIETQLADQLASVNIDPNILQNALLNLAINSRDAMQSGGVITIETSSVIMNGEAFSFDLPPAFGPHILLSVKDNGSGIKPEDQDHVFEPFFTTKPVGQGSGLGLSMVYGFMVQSKGYVAIESAPEKGTTVNLYIPCVSETVEEPATAKSPRIVDFATDKTILLVEDDLDVRRTTAKILGQLGFRIIEAESGPMALGILETKAHSIDLVFSDIVMPSGISGIVLARWIKIHYKTVRVLLASGYPDKIRDGQHDDSFRLSILAKPYRRSDLIAALSDVFNKPIE